LDCAETQFQRDDNRDAKLAIAERAEFPGSGRMGIAQDMRHHIGVEHISMAHLRRSTSSTGNSPASISGQSTSTGSRLSRNSAQVAGLPGAGSTGSMIRHLPSLVTVTSVPGI